MCPAGRAGGGAVTDGGENERSGAHAQKPQTAATAESVSAERAGTEIHKRHPLPFNTFLIMHFTLSKSDFQRNRSVLSASVVDQEQ